MSALPAGDAARRSYPGFRPARVSHQCGGGHDEAEGQDRCGMGGNHHARQGEPACGGTHLASGERYHPGHAVRPQGHSGTGHQPLSRLPRKPYTGRNQGCHMDAAHLAREVLFHACQRLFAGIDRSGCAGMLLERPVHPRYRAAGTVPAQREPLGEVCRIPYLPPSACSGGTGMVPQCRPRLG